MGIAWGCISYPGVRQGPSPWLGIVASRRCGAPKDDAAEQFVLCEGVFHPFVNIASSIEMQISVLVFAVGGHQSQTLACSVQQSGLLLPPLGGRPRFRTSAGENWLISMKVSRSVLINITRKAIPVWYFSHIVWIHRNKSEIVKL